MWESGGGRKYSMPHAGINSYTEDLHAWSIYRQNLNADFSESALGINKSSNSERPYGNFQLKETTVNNILNHPKYGPKMKSQDAYTYLRFGLPRVKASQSEIGGVGTSSMSRKIQNHHTLEHLDGNHNHNHNNGVTSSHQTNLPRHYHASSHQNRAISAHPIASDSSNESENAYHDHRHERSRRTWKSDPDLLRNKNESAFNQNHANPINVASHQQPSNSHQHYQRHHHSHNHENHRSDSKLQHIKGSTSFFTSNPKAQSESDLRFGGFNHAADLGSSHHDISNAVPPKHPHLLVRNLNYEVDKSSIWRRMCGVRRQKLKVLDNINFEVRAGEILAIMATNEQEGTAIMDILSNQYNRNHGKVKGDIIFNGVYMTSDKMTKLLAYVKQDTLLCPLMSTRQCLLFSSLLQGPAKKSSFDTKKRTNALIEELGLNEVRHTSISDLTDAEKRRLMIAINLLLDTDIILLDQAVKGMDIFDTFFLVEYLRQWALISGRCVIMTISPSTFEIFTMLSRIALISTGRMVYFGKRKEMLSYFSHIDFPCPAYKNPSDYYLDLVTLDNLSDEAMSESSSRIESLVELFSRRSGNSLTNPGPPSLIPQPIHKSNFIMQFLAIWIRALIFEFPYNVIHLFRNIFIALLLSIMCGTIYWNVRGGGREQEFVWDRIGFYSTMLAILPIPLLLVELNDIHKEKQYVLNETKIGLYSKGSYIVSKLIFSSFQATIVFLAFSLPAYSMAGLHNSFNLVFYLILMLTYLHSLRILILAMSWIFDKRSTAAIAFGFIISILLLSSGTSFHFKDLSIATRWLYLFSPMRWTHEALIGWEFESNSTTPPFLCSKNPIVQQPNAILVRADCGFQTRDNIMKWFGYKIESIPTSTFNTFSLQSLDLMPLWTPAVALSIFFSFFLFISCIGFYLMSHRKHHKINHK